MSDRIHQTIRTVAAVVVAGALILMWQEQSAQTDTLDEQMRSARSEQAVQARLLRAEAHQQAVAQG